MNETTHTHRVLTLSYLTVLSNFKSFSGQFCFCDDIKNLQNLLYGAVLYLWWWLATLGTRI